MRRAIKAAGLLVVWLLLGGAFCPSGSSSSIVIPAPMLASYIANNGSPSLGSLQANAPKYNTAIWFTTGGTDGTVTIDLTNETSAQLKIDVAAWEASTDSKGHHRIAGLQINDCFANAGNGTYLTATNATNAVNSIKGLVSTYGFQFINWDLETGSGATSGNFGTCWNQTTVESINSQLRSAIPGFLISGAPRPFELHAGTVKRGWTVTDDFTIPQYYFGDGAGNAAFLCAQIQALEGGTDGNNDGLAQYIGGNDGGVTMQAKQMILGNDANHAGAQNTTACTASQYSTAFTNLNASFPGLGGMSVWQANADAATTYGTASNFGTALGL